MKWPMAVAVMMTLSSCALARVDQAEPIPAGPPPELGLAATGPIIVIGQGVAHGIGWRYSVYESDEGWCTQLEEGGSGGAACGGDLAPPPGQVFGSYGWGSSQNGLAYVEGIVSSDVASVVVTPDGRPVQATLMSLDRPGVDAQAFVAFFLTATEAQWVTALDADGQVLAREGLR